MSLPFSIQVGLAVNVVQLLLFFTLPANLLEGSTTISCATYPISHHISYIIYHILFFTLPANLFRRLNYYLMCYVSYISSYIIYHISYIIYLLFILPANLFRRPTTISCSPPVSYKETRISLLGGCCN